MWKATEIDNPCIKTTNQSSNNLKENFTLIHET